MIQFKYQDNKPGFSIDDRFYSLELYQVQDLLNNVYVVMDDYTLKVNANILYLSKKSSYSREFRITGIQEFLLGIILNDYAIVDSEDFVLC